MRIFTSAPRLAAVSCLVAALSWAAVPTPKEHFGFIPGDDYKLANYQEITRLFPEARASHRSRAAGGVREDFEGKPMFARHHLRCGELARRLTSTSEINRRLALGEATPEEARQLANEGKAIVWIDSGLHATEVAPAQHAPTGLRMVLATRARRRSASART